MKKKICSMTLIIVMIFIFIQCMVQDIRINDYNEILIKQIEPERLEEDEICNLPTTEIIEQTLEDEQIQEQKVEDETFELQGEIAYEGDRARSWNVTLGDYKGLSYYSQLDGRWKNKIYSSVEKSNQTIGNSGCGPTAAAMIITACKGAILPDEVADLFVEYGYRSANNGTYWSAFRAIADEFDIEYTERSNLNSALDLLKNNNYVVASVGNGLFTTGGHFIVLVGFENNRIKIYDPYLYAGKFDTSYRRGKAIVDGNTVYVTVDNFAKYANAKGFFCYKHDLNVEENKPEVVVSSYTRYVNTNTKNLNVRVNPNGRVVDSLKKGTKVVVYETAGNWSKIGDNRWVSSEYLSTGMNEEAIFVQYKIGKYVVNASVLNVRTGASTNYYAKKYYQLSANARMQNKSKGNYYTNGYRKGIVFNVLKVDGNWGYTPSGWVCLDYCTKI